MPSEYPRNSHRRIVPIRLGRVLALLPVMTTLAVANDVTWDGGGGNSINWQTGNNWDPNGTPVSGDVIIFDGTVKTTSNNNINSLSVAAIKFAADGFVLQGTAVDLDGNLETSTGTTGTNVIELGLNLQSDTDVILNESGSTLEVSGPITGSGTLKITKAGTLILSGSNALTGETLITDNATLLVNNTTGNGTGDISEVVQNATLGGSGTIGGDVSKMLGTITGGTAGGIGTLTVTGNINSENDGTWLIDIIDDMADRIDVGGSLDLSNASLQLNVSGTQTGNLVIASYSTLTGSFNSVSGLPTGYSIDYNYLGQNQVALIVPEPATILPLAALLVPWLIQRRRAQTASGRTS